MFVVLFLTVGSLFFYLDRPVSGAFDCATTVYNKWSTCDTAYSNTASQYSNRTSYCVANAPSTCPAISESTCDFLAIGHCANDPNPQACYDLDYAACCKSASEAACEATLAANYNNRGNSYFSCMGFEGNFGNCIEEVADFCLDAQNRVSECSSIYPGFENSSARSTCIANSGIDHE
jgi:hypothetical protein